MGRQKKNELDAILEQLKQSYGTAQDDDLEDSLLETEESEEDAELASVLEKIFASSSVDSVSKVEEVEPAEAIDGVQIDEEEQVTGAEYETTETTTEGEPCESGDDAIEEESEEDESEEIDDADVDVETVTDDINEETDEEYGEGLDEEMDAQIVAEIDRFEMGYSGENIDKSFEKKIEEFLDEMEKADNSDEEERVDDVLKMMFHKDTASDETTLNETAADENADDENVSEEDTFNDFFNADSNEALTDDELLLDIDVFPDSVDEYTQGDDLALNELLCEPAEASWEESEPEIPAKILVLDPSEYTSDILQHSLDQMSLFKPEEDINYSLFDSKDAEEEEQTNTSEESARSIPKTEINDNDVSLLLKFGYKGEIASSVGNEYAQTVVVENNNEYVPPKHKITHGFVDKEFSGNGQIGTITKKYKSDKNTLLVLGIIVSVITLALFVCDVMASLAIGSRDYTSMIAIELSLVLAIVACLWKRLYSGCLAIIRFDANLYSLLSVIIAEYLAYCFAICILFAVSPALAYSRIYAAFGGFVSLYASFTVWAEYLDCCRESNTFNIMSDGDLHCVLEKNIVDESAKSSQLAYNVKKTSFVSGFFRRMFDRSIPNVKIVIVVGVIPFVAIIVGIATSILRDSIMMGLNSAGYVMFSAFPLSYALIPSIVEYVHSLKLSGSHTAFIGIPAVDEYAGVDTLSFADEDAVEITALTEINPNKSNESSKKWINIASNVFEALGGPLSKTVHRANAEESNIRHDATINSISENGIDLYFDSSMNVLIGDRHYMLAHNIKVKTDTNLSTAVKGVDKTVIYLAFDGVPKIGFIVTSKVKLSFLKTVELLEKHNIKIIVNSYEPEINDYYFESNKIDKSVSVSKPATYEHREPSCIADSGIIAQNPHDLCKTLIYSKIILNDRKTTKRIRVIQTVFGFIVAGFLVAVSALSATTIFVELLQANTMLLFYVCAILGLTPNVIHIVKLLRKK